MCKQVRYYLLQLLSLTASHLQEALHLLHVCIPIDGRICVSRSNQPRVPKNCLQTFQKLLRGLRCLCNCKHK